MRLLALLFPGFPDLLAWVAARHRGWLPLLLVGAACAAVVRFLLLPLDTVGRVRQGREQARRRARIKQQTDSLYPLW